MQFEAKSAAPQPAQTELRQPALNRAVEGSITLFTAPAGYLMTECLAAVLAEQGRQTVWLRLGPEDHDPATFLISLIGAARRVSPRSGATTLDHMRRRSGPIAGWAPLFAQLGQELAGVFATSTVVVIEHIHYLNSGSPALEMLGAHLLPSLASHFACILTTQQSLPSTALPAQTKHHNATDLRLGDAAALALADQAQASLTTRCIHSAVVLTEGRARALASLCVSCAAIGPKLVEQAVSHASDLNDLLARLARAWMMAADADMQQVLSLTMHLGYSHPALTQAVFGKQAQPTRPWLQLLTEGWTRLHRLWRTPLQAVLHLDTNSIKQMLQRAAQYLVDQGAVEQAVPLYFKSGDSAGAAKAIAQSADSLMDTGQWQTLSDWLGKLPASALRVWPRLVYLSGELAAAQGRTKSARHTFALAADLFTANHDDSGACQSLLAASALEAQQGDMSKAQASALAAKSIAETAGLMEHQSWTVWQLGRLAALRGELDDALAYFDQATVAPHVGDQSSLDLGQQIKSLLQRQRELHQKHESSRQAYLAAEQDERQALRQLDAAINNPSLGWLAGLKGYGQSHAPLTLKLPMSTHGPPRRASILERLARTMGLGQKSPEDAVALSAITPKAIPTQAVPTEEPTDIPTVLSVAQNTTETATVAASEPIAAPAVTPTLTVYMLGTFRVAVNGRSIDKWPSGRGRAVLKYLLMHTSRPTPRDVLMETFWPDSAPDASRNNLNVALYGLRRALRAVTDLPVIVFEDGTYRLNSDFQLWIDVGEFERQAAAGQRLEITGKLSAAVKQYEAAVNLYQDDFLADDPYEEWTVLPREKFRIVYLDTLDRLSRIFFNQAQYDDCARLCKLILSRDNCREDTHCCLMRCYSRLGQHHLAVRQYQVCVEALAAQLEIDPSPDTTQLYKLICRREAV